MRASATGRFLLIAALIAALIAVAGGMVLGQERGAPEEAAPTPTSADAEDVLARPRFMVYLFEAEPDTLSEQEEFLLYNSILTAAAAANSAVVVLEAPDPEVPGSRTAKEALAQSINTDSWLHVIASGGLENLTVEAETFDMLRRETYGKQVIRPGFVVDYRVLAAGLWDGIVETLQESYTRVVDRTTLTIRARPGTQVLGLPSEAELGPSGELAVSVPSSSALSLVADLEGHYQVRRGVFVGIDPLTVEFDLVEKPSYGLDVRLSSLQFPGVRFWYYPRPAEIFVRAGFVTQAVGFFPIDNTESLVRAGSTLSFFDVDGGLYLTPAEDFFRFYAAAGFYVRFVHPSLGEIALERDGAPIALTVSLGAEYSSLRRLRFFFEYQPALILADDPDRFLDISFVSNRYPSGRVPGYLDAGWGVLDYRNLYIGARWDF